MANSYTQFSFAFVVKGSESKEWIDRLVDKSGATPGYWNWTQRSTR